MTHRMDMNTGNRILRAMNSNYRIAATLNSLETWFVSGTEV